MGKRMRLILGILLVLLVLSGITYAGGGGPLITKWVIGGGTTRATAGNATLDGTIGQSPAGVFSVAISTPSGVRAQLCSGFWCSGRYYVYAPVVLR